MDVWVSNSDATNDFWAQKRQTTIYFTVEGADTPAVGGSGVTDGGQLMADMAEEIFQKRQTKTEIDSAWTGDWCAPLVAHCAEQAGLSGEGMPFLAGAQNGANRAHANPFCLLKPNQAKVYYYYETDKTYSSKNGIWSFKNWRSANCPTTGAGKDVTFFMKDFLPKFLSDRTAYEPVPGDLVFLKKSTVRPGRM